MRSVTRAAVSCLTFVLAVAALTFAQSQSSRAFDVASVKPTPPGSTQLTTMVAQPGGRFVATSAPLRLLIRTAFQLQDDQIVGGPAWINTERFDIVARSDAPDSLPQLTPMMQTLIVDRFKLAFHRETRELPVFALVTVKKDGTLGPGLRPTACPDVAIDLARTQPCANVSNDRGRLTMRGMPFFQFPQFLAPFVNRVLVDQSGLTGRYDVDLTWTPDRAPSAADVPANDPNAVSIFTAIQEQLGLRLESTRAPVEVLVIDRVERPGPD